MSLRETCGEGESLTNIRLFQIGKIHKQRFDGAACRHGFHNHAYSYPHAADTGLATHDLRIHSNAVELLHVVMITQGI